MRAGCSCSEAVLPSSAGLCRRGRRALTWLTLAEVAEGLGFDSVEPLGRLLSFLPGAFPGAVADEVHGWLVPSTTMRALRRPRVGVELAQEATVAEVAGAIRRPVQTIWRWCQRGPRGEAAVLRSRKVAGVLLVDVRSVMELPAKLPGWLAEGVKQRRMVSGVGKVLAKGAVGAGTGVEVGAGAVGPGGDDGSRALEMGALGIDDALIDVEKPSEQRKL